MYRWWKRHVEATFVRELYARGIIGRRERNELIDFIYDKGGQRREKG